MTRQRLPSKQTLAVLAALAESPSEWRHGYDLMAQTGLASGTLYPLLMRLCDQGLLETQWAPSPLRGRPPRHAYRLTAPGLARAAALTQKNGAIIDRGLPA